MKKLLCSSASLGIMLLMVGSMPGTLSGQPQTQSKTPAAAPAAPSLPEPAAACPDSKRLPGTIEGLRAY